MAENGGKLSAAAKKSLGKRQGKPGRLEIKEKDLPKYLTEKLAHAKLKEWTSWAH